MVPTGTELAGAVREATRAAVTDLFREFPGHRFCWIALMAPGEAYGPALPAWSHEALAEAAEGSSCAADLTWSYADPPFCCHGEQHLEPVRALFVARPQVFDLPDDEAGAEYRLRMRAMETALAQSDGEGLFGRGAERLGIVVNVETVQPDATDTERAPRLNPPEALTAWLTEAAVPERC